MSLFSVMCHKDPFPQIIPIVNIKSLTPIILKEFPHVSEELVFLIGVQSVESMMKVYAV